MKVKFRRGIFWAVKESLVNIYSLPPWTVTLSKKDESKYLMVTQNYQNLLPSLLVIRLPSRCFDNVRF